MSIYVETTPDIENIDEQQAITTVQEAIDAGTDVLDYSLNREQYQIENKQAAIPTKIHPTLAGIAERSPEEAALIYGDPSTLNKLGKAWDDASDGYNVVPKMTRLRDLTWKSMFDKDTMTDQEWDEYDVLKYETNSSGIEDRNLLESVPKEVGTQIGIMKNTIQENYGKILSTGAAAATAGAGVGSVLGGLPGAVIVGVPAFTLGLGTGATVAFWKDEVKLNTTMTYNSLEGAITTEGKTLDEVTRKNIALGAGLLMGTVETVIGRATAKLVPGLNKIFGSTGYIRKAVANPTAYATVKAIANLGAAMGLQGTGEASQEVISVLAESLANADGSWTEAQFQQALNDALWKWNERTGKMESRIGEAGAMGALVGGTIIAPTTPLVYKMERVNAVQNGSPEAQAIAIEGGEVPGIQVTDVIREKMIKAKEAVNFQEKLGAVIGMEQATKLAQKSSTVLDKIQTEFMENSDLRYLYMDPAELAEAITDEGKRETVRRMLGIEETIIKDAPVQVSTIKFIQSVREFPELIDLAMKDQDSDSVLGAKKFLDNFEKMKATESMILETLKDDTTITEEQKAKVVMEQLTGEVLKDDPQYDDVVGPSTYINRPIMPEEARAALSEGEYNKMMMVRREARLNRSKKIDSMLDAEYTKLQDQAFEMEMEGQIQNEFNALVNHKGLTLADKFVDASFVEPVWFKNKDLRVFKNTHHKEGYSIFAIDPRDPVTKKIRPELMAYTKNPQMKKHKVFVKGGMQLEEVAQFLGYADPMMMLETLKSTPTRKDLAELKAKKHEYEIRRKVETNIQPTLDEIETAYNNAAKNHIDELKYLVINKWSATKAEIRRMIMGIPSTDQLIKEARSLVLNSKISQLTPKLFERAENRADRRAFQSFAKGDMYNMMSAKLDAVRALLADKESKKALKKVNRDLRFVRRYFSDKDNITALKQAGHTYYDAAMAIVQTFNFKIESDKVIDAKESFRKFTEKMVEIGKGDFTLPDRMLDQRRNVKDLTVNEVFLLTDMLRRITHQAEMKNRLIRKNELTKQVIYMEEVGANVENQLSKLSQYDRDRIIENQLDREQVNILRRTPALLRRIESIMNQLDKGQGVNGYMHQTFFQPLATALQNKAVDIDRVFQEVSKAIDKYGRDDYMKINAEEIEIPEFKGFEGLKGRATKGQLVQMLLNFGNEGNIKRLENFGISRDVLFDVLQRELGQREMEYVQDIWDIIESLKPKVAEVELQFNGVEPDWVEASPVTFKGKGMTEAITYRGGYYRIIYDNETDFTKTREILLGAGEKRSLEEMIQRKHYSQAMTKQHHLETRMNGVNMRISLDTSNTNQIIEEILHDVHMRIPVNDTARLLAEQKVAESITAVVGRQQYNAITEWIVDAANSNLDAARNGSESLILQILARFSGAQNVAALGLRFSTAIIQTVSIPAAVLKMGASGAKYIGIVSSRILMNPMEFAQGLAYASERFPELKLNIQNLDLDYAKALEKYSPSKKRGKIRNWIDLNTRRSDDLMFYMIGMMDSFAKTTVWQAAYLQAINGEAKGVRGGDEIAARNYAATVVRTTQTANNIIDKSPVQKVQWFSNLFGKFYSQLSIIHNLYAEAFNDVKDSQIEAHQIIYEGNYSADAIKKAFGTQIKGLSSFAAAIMLLGIVPSVFIKITKGDALPGDDESDESWLDFAKRESVMSVASGIPAVNSIAWSLFNNKNYTRPVNIPITKTFTDLMVASQALYKLHKDAVEGTGQVLNDKEKKALLDVTGIASAFIIGRNFIPTQSIWSTLQMMKDLDFSKVQLDTYDKTKSQLEEIINDPNAQPEYVEAAKQMLDIVAPEAPASEIVPDFDSFKVLIAEIESGNTWYARNPKSSAAGLYQFTKGTWEWVMQEAPELELTEKGRINRDTSQQEAAFKWFTEYNAKQLQKVGIELTPENLYAAHFLGASGAIEVLSQPDTYRLSTIVGERVMGSNDFKSGMKVEDFKEWLKKKLKNAEKETLKKETLTSESVG